MKKGGGYDEPGHLLWINIFSPKATKDGDRIELGVRLIFYLQKAPCNEGNNSRTCIKAKSMTKLGWRDCCSKTERQWSRPLLRISIIGAGRILWTCANGKITLFRDDLQKVSSGNMEYILRGT